MPSTAELAVRAGIALLVVLGVALVSLRWLARRGFGPMGARGAGTLSVEGRLVLEPRRSVYIVRAGDKRLVIGVSEAGISTLAELGPDDAASVVTPPVDQAA